jgi:hypothetical protein
LEIRKKNVKTVKEPKKQILQHCISFGFNTNYCIKNIFLLFGTIPTPVVNMLTLVCEYVLCYFFLFWFFVFVFLNKFKPLWSILKFHHTFLLICHYLEKYHTCPRTFWTTLVACPIILLDARIVNLLLN